MGFADDLDVLDESQEDTDSRQKWMAAKCLRQAKGQRRRRMYILFKTCIKPWHAGFGNGLPRCGKNANSGHITNG